VFPELAGRIILEDSAATVAHTPAIEGVEKVGHDLFTLQPVKGKYIFFSLELSASKPPISKILKATVLTS
jgi:hypothetical protein